MRVNLKDYVNSLGLDEINLNDIFRRLGYFDDEIFRNVTIDHPLTTLKFDYGLIKYGDDKYGIVVCIGNVDEKGMRKLEGICRLVGAKYGVLTDLREMVIIGEDGAYLDYIPDRDSLRIELGLVDAYALAMSYDEFEKVSDADFIVKNSRYVYSDMDRDRVVIFLPNRKLIEWLEERNVKFELLEAGNIIDK